MMITPPLGNLLWLVDRHTIRTCGYMRILKTWNSCRRSHEMFFGTRNPQMTNRNRRRSNLGISIVDMHQMAARGTHFFGGFRR